MGLTPERWREVLRLHAEALTLPEAEREAFLERECADEELRAEVRRMLAAPDTDAFLEPPPLDQPAAGRDLGDFTLLEEIGRGGMGVVYRALQRSLGRIVAVKVLPASFALPQRTIERFEREARTMARLAHPNLVSILAFGEERGLRYIAMEYVDGPSLAQELLRLRADLGAEDDRRAHLPSSRASDYFRSVAENVRQVADGLAFSHEHGIVHRDVKPSNLLLDPSGRVKVVDFGLARDEHLGSLSTSGDLVGTPHYMSPEQARAQRHVVDHRTDIYSLGVVLYELLTLQRPFEGGTSQEVIQNLLHREPPRVRRLNPRVPSDLALICSKAMSRDPEDRYRTAAELRDDLGRLLAHEAIRARPPGPHQLLARAVRRRRHLVGAIAIAVVTAGAVLLAVRWQAEEERVGALVATVAGALEEASLGDLPLARLLGVRSALATLEQGHWILAAEREEVVVEARRQMAVLRSQLTERGRSLLALSRDPSRSDGEREASRLSALLNLRFASDVFPEDDVLRELGRAESSYPALTVSAVDARGAEIPADISVGEVDVMTSVVGPRRRLGRAPLTRAPILPGYYRVVVAFDAGGFRELICTPGPASMEVVLTARRRDDEEHVASGMVALGGERYTFPSFACEQPFSGRAVDLGRFWLDPTEVSNREYVEFVRATGHPMPRALLEEPDIASFLARYGDLPVVGVTWRDAVAYAEWRGKRLPTAAEWHRAAGGLAGRRLPYSDAPDAPLLGNVSTPSSLDVSGYLDAWHDYLRCAVPVRSHPEACSPEGVYHLFGNVYEYTESMVATRTGVGESFTPRPHDRWLYGGAWDASRLDEGMRTPYYQGTGPSDHAYFIGFRCAKSAEP